MAAARLAAKAAPIRFTGAPTRMTAMFPAMQGATRSGVVVMADGEPLPLTIRRMHSATTSPALLSFRLPKSTRPGSYAGSAEVGEARISVVIDVEARPRVKFLPSKVAFRAGPGARVEAQVTVVNLGNTEVAVEAKSSFCVFDSHGVEHAFYAALTEEKADGRERIDRVMDELAESHGGMVRAVVVKGAGKLDPEECRELTVEFQFARRLRGGQTYVGQWLVGRSGLEVEIEAVGVGEDKDGGVR
jgi:hypothetical protein